VITSSAGRAIHRSRGALDTSARFRNAWSSISTSCCQRDGGAFVSVMREPLCASAQDAAQSAAMVMARSTVVNPNGVVYTILVAMAAC